MIGSKGAAERKRRPEEEWSEGGDPMNNQPCNCPTVFCYIQSRSQRLEGREGRDRG